MVKESLNNYIENGLQPFLSVNVLTAQKVGDTVRNIDPKEALKLLHIENNNQCSSNAYQNNSFDTFLFHKPISRTFCINNAKNK
ncbi:MAG: hypothetical protein QM768_15355 [Agriterribacter sp.]